MFGLIYKDMLLKKRFLIIFASAMIVMSVVICITMSLTKDYMEDNAVKASSLCLSTYTVMFIAADCIGSMLFSHDETKGWLSFGVSTPLAARGMIKAKYLEVLIILFTAAHWAYFNDITVGFFIEKYESLTILIAVLLFFTIILKSIEIPFAVYFGEKNGNNVKTIILLIMLFIVGVYALFGDISMFGSGEDILKWIVNTFSGENGSEAMMNFFAVLPYAAAAMYYISYRISCRIYTKGAVNYVS